MNDSPILIDLIDQIRKGEIILWVGSGFSTAAGYPSASELVEIIKKKVKDEDKIFFENKFSLDDVTEEYTRLHKRQGLLEIIISTFSTEPKNLSIAKMLAEIPQFRIIITTNYDKVLECVYENHIKIVNDNDLQNSKEKVKIYKLHGDIYKPESMIINKTDYINVLKNQRDSILWSEIKSLLSQNSILFIGYSFNDVNINLTFFDILERLGVTHKNNYLISPNLPVHQQEYLKNNYSINYINMKAEEAIPVIKNNIERHLMDDARNGNIPISIVQKVFEDRKLKPEFIVKKDGKLDLKSIVSLDKSIKTMGKIKYTVNGKYLEEIKKIKDIIDGKVFGKYELSAEKGDLIVETTMKDILLINGDESKVKVLTIESKPLTEIKANISLTDCQKSYSNIDGKLYLSQYAFQITLTPPGFEFSIYELRENFTEGVLNNVTFNFKDQVKNINQGYDAYSFINELINGDELKIKINFHDSLLTIPKSSVKISKSLRNHLVKIYKIYSALLKIQNEFNVTFDTIDNITNKDIKAINELCDIVDNKITDGELTFKITSPNKEAILNSIDNYSSNVESITNETFNILNKNIILNDYTITIPDGYVTNKEEVLKQLNKNKKEIKMKFASRTNKIYRSYQTK